MTTNEWGGLAIMFALGIVYIGYCTIQILKAINTAHMDVIQEIYKLQNETNKPVI